MSISVRAFTQLHEEPDGKLQTKPRWRPRDSKELARCKVRNGSGSEGQLGCCFRVKTWIRETRVRGAEEPQVPSSTGFLGCILLMGMVAKNSPFPRQVDIVEPVIH